MELAAAADHAAASQDRQAGALQVRPSGTESLSSLVVQVTLLHLSTVKQLLQSALAEHAVDVVEARVHSLYDSLPQGQWALLRQTLAGFLLGKRVKVRHQASLLVPCTGHKATRTAQGQWPCCGRPWQVSDGGARRGEA